MNDGRYSRQVWVPRFGEKSQDALRRSSIGVVGAGGVKSPMLLYLTSAGVGKIRIIDFDRVEISNLNRQILYGTSDVGAYKAEAAAVRLRDLNPEVEIEPIVARLDESNFNALLGDCDLIVEGGDSGAARATFNRCALREQRTYVHASAHYNYAYVMTVVPGASACFECVFRDLPSSHGGAVPVIGTATAVSGSVAASEIISILRGAGPTLDRQMFFFDGWTNWATHLPNPRLSGCPGCGDMTSISPRLANSDSEAAGPNHKHSPQDHDPRRAVT